MSSDPNLPRLRRRDFLALSVVAAGGLAALKIGGRFLVGAAEPEPPVDMEGVVHLSPRQGRIVTAAALAMLGDAAAEAYAAGKWRPAREIDGLLGRLPAGQRTQIGVGLNLLEEWTWGLRGFSSWSIADRRALLAAWKNSSLEAHRGIWGFLHVASAAAFSGTEAGWEVMDYPGPCIGTGRAPGQTAHFEWDEVVP